MSGEGKKTSDNQAVTTKEYLGISPAEFTSPDNPSPDVGTVTNPIAGEKYERITNNAILPVSTRDMDSVTPNVDVNASPNIVEIKVPVDGTRRQTRYLDSAGKIYPAPVDLDDAVPLDDPGLYGS